MDMAMAMSIITDVSPAKRKLLAVLGIFPTNTDFSMNAVNSMFQALHNNDVKLNEHEKVDASDTQNYVSMLMDSLQSINMVRAYCIRMHFCMREEYEIVAKLCLQKLSLFQQTVLVDAYVEFYRKILELNSLSAYDANIEHITTIQDLVIDIADEGTTQLSTNVLNKLVETLDKNRTIVLLQTRIPTPKLEQLKAAVKSLKLE